MPTKKHLKSTTKTWFYRFNKNIHQLSSSRNYHSMTTRPLEPLSEAPS